MFPAARRRKDKDSALEARPIGLAVAILALIMGAGASFLLDDGPTPEFAPAVLAGVLPTPALVERESDESAAPLSVAATAAPDGVTSGAAPPDPAADPIAADTASESDTTEIAAVGERAPAAAPAGSDDADSDDPGADDRAGAPVAAPATPIAWAQPLQNLAPGVVDRLLAIENNVAIVAIDLRRDLVFTHQGDAYFDLASVAKVPLMLALLRDAERQQRSISEQDQLLLQLMIQWSDNDATNVVWDRVGGMARELLADLGISHGFLFINDNWGGGTGNAEAVARLFQAIVQGDTLSPAVRDGAMRLLDGVAAVQRWGISDGLPPEGPRVGLKNGWYPNSDGWLVHSAGYVLDPDGNPDYVVVVLSADHETLADGVSLVEAIAADLHAALRPAANDVSLLRR
ncbi:MAG: Beta-lactamase enzyme family protein [Chloroflexi bacterium]|nr:MAG: Beta-lactamase enzyme family protein [Chloroflexota bacterium]